MNIFTDEDIKEIVGPWGDTPIKGYTRSLFDRIEAKLREKEVSNQVCDHGHLRRVCEICQRDEEIEQLKAERDALKAAAEKGTEYVLAQINQDLRTERDALVRKMSSYIVDAARYRWLRDFSPMFETVRKTKENIDAAIDVARGAT